MLDGVHCVIHVHKGGGGVFFFFLERLGMKEAIPCPIKGGGGRGAWASSRKFTDLICVYFSSKVIWSLFFFFLPKLFKGKVDYQKHVFCPSASLFLHVAAL